MKYLPPETVRNSYPTVTCYKCSEDIKPRVIADYGEAVSLDYWCASCGPMVYWTVLTKAGR